VYFVKHKCKLCFLRYDCKLVFLLKCRGCHVALSFVLCDYLQLRFSSRTVLKEAFPKGCVIDYVWFETELSFSPWDTNFSSLLKNHIY
jgi:hypothetical protein